MRRQALLMIPLVIVLAACAGPVSSTSTHSTSTPAATVAHAPSPPLDCSTLFEKDGFSLTPDSAAGLSATTLLYSAGATQCTWIATIWDFVTLTVLPQTDDALPPTDCSVSDEGGGDHESCRFDAYANGYRLSGFLGGAKNATESDVLELTKPIVAAFDSAASAAVAGGEPSPRPVPIDCASIAVPGRTFTEHAAEGVLPTVGIGPSVTRAEMFRLSSSRECESTDDPYYIRVTVIPEVSPHAAATLEDSGIRPHVPGADLAVFTGDVPAEFGATIYLLRGSTFVQISQGSKSRATQLELCAAVLAALAQ